MITLMTIGDLFRNCAIVGSGPSLTGVKIDFDRNNCFVIAVNGGVHLVDDPDFFFTLDPSPLNIERIEKHLGDTVPIIALPEGYAKPVPNRCIVKRRVHDDGNGRYKHKLGMSDDNREIYTGNSLTGAIQLAVHMGAKNIALFGMDGHGGYVNDGEFEREKAPHNLYLLPELCEGLKPHLDARGVRVVNGSPDSAVTTWERMTPQAAMEWINNS